MIELRDSRTLVSSNKSRELYARHLSWTQIITARHTHGASQRPTKILRSPIRFPVVSIINLLITIA